MKLADIEAIAEITKQHNLLFAVDNTFATPYLQKPLDLGADIVMHSATKYLGGHSDVIAGALVIKDEALGKQLHFTNSQPEQHWDHKNVFWCCGESKPCICV